MNLSTVLDSAVSEEHLIAFRLGAETYAVEIGLVHEIVRMCTITRIPRTPVDVEGVINLRGKIVPIVDMRQRLRMPPAERSASTRIMIVEIDGMTVGAIVDAVTGVLRLSRADVEPSCALVSDPDTDYIRGVGKQGDDLILLLNIVKALSVGPISIGTA